MRAPHRKLKRTKNKTQRNRRQGAPPHKVQSNRNRNHSENKPAARRLDGTGCTSTSEMPRPTVSPIETEMSWRAVWKPDRYDSFVDDPDSVCDTNVNRPPFASPDGSWNRMPVICSTSVS